MGLPCIPRLIKPEPWRFGIEVSDRAAFLLSKVISVNQGWNRSVIGMAAFIILTVTIWGPYYYQTARIISATFISSTDSPLSSGFPHSPLSCHLALGARTLFWFCWKPLLPWRCPKHHQEETKGLFNSFLNLYDAIFFLAPSLVPISKLCACVLRSVA